MFLGRTLLICAILFVGMNAAAHMPKEGDVFGAIGPIVQQTVATHTNDATNLFPSVGFAGLGEADLDQYGGIDGGIIYEFKTYQRTFGNSLVASRVHKVEIPLGYRFWFNPHISAALDFSASYTIGVSQVNYSSVINSDQSTQATALAEYGLVFGVQWEFWRFEKLSVLADGRYFYSLSANPGEDANQAQLIFGVKYLLNEKRD